MTQSQRAFIRISFLLSLFGALNIAVCLISGCGTDTSDTRTKETSSESEQTFAVRNGSEIPETYHPAVGKFTSDAAGSKLKTECTGTIIPGKTCAVLTADHCSFGNLAYFHSNGKSAKVSGFVGGPQGYDIAIALLDKPINGLNDSFTIATQTQKFLPNELVTEIGFGFGGAGRELGTKRVGSLKFLGYQEVDYNLNGTKKTYKVARLKPATADGQLNCGGDSGGPVLGQNNWISGIVSGHKSPSMSINIACIRPVIKNAVRPDGAGLQTCVAPAGTTGSPLNIKSGCFAKDTTLTYDFIFNQMIVSPTLWHYVASSQQSSFATAEAYCALANLSDDQLLSKASDLARFIQKSPTQNAAAVTEARAALNQFIAVRGPYKSDWRLPSVRELYELGSTKFRYKVIPITMESDRYWATPANPNDPPIAYQISTGSQALAPKGDLDSCDSADEAFATEVAATQPWLTTEINKINCGSASVKATGKLDPSDTNMKVGEKFVVSSPGQRDCAFEVKMSNAGKLSIEGDQCLFPAEVDKLFTMNVTTPSTNIAGITWECLIGGAQAFILRDTITYTPKSLSPIACAFVPIAKVPAPPKASAKLSAYFTTDLFSALDTKIIVKEVTNGMTPRVVCENFANTVCETSGSHVDDEFEISLRLANGIEMVVDQTKNRWVVSPAPSDLSTLKADPLRVKLKGNTTVSAKVKLKAGYALLGVAASTPYPEIRFAQLDANGAATNEMILPRFATNFYAVVTGQKYQLKGTKAACNVSWQASKLPTVLITNGNPTATATFTAPNASFGLTATVVCPVSTTTMPPTTSRPTTTVAPTTTTRAPTTTLPTTTTRVTTTSVPTITLRVVTSTVSSTTRIVGPLRTLPSTTTTTRPTTTTAPSKT